MESFRPVFAVKMAQNGFQYFVETTIMDSVKSPFEIQIARAYYDMEMRDSAPPRLYIRGTRMQRSVGRKNK